MECCQNRCFFVGVTKMYINRRVYLCNAILVTVIFCRRYSTFCNSTQKWCFKMKFGDLFSNLLLINHMKFCLNLFRFDIFIVRCLGSSFFRAQCSCFRIANRMIFWFTRWQQQWSLISLLPNYSIQVLPSHKIHRVSLISVSLAHIAWHQFTLPGHGQCIVFAPATTGTHRA